MKIWFLTGEFSPDFGGGIGTYVENCAKMFANAGDDVTVIVRSLNGDKVEKAEEGYRIVRFQQGEALPRPISPLAGRGRIWYIRIR